MGWRIAVNPNGPHPCNPSGLAPGEAAQGEVTPRGSGTRGGAPPRNSNGPATPLYNRWCRPNSPIQFILTPPHSHNSATVDVETGSKLFKHRGWETLREYVGELRCHRDMKDADLTDGDLFSNEVKINLHMLSALVLNGVVGEVYDTYVVVVDERTP
jgi:hypothetical protein